MAESGYNNSLYNDAVYGSNIYKVGTIISCGLKARIIPAPNAYSPPVIDTIVEGFVERFDWLQQCLQSMELLSKIEYAPGRDPDHPDDELNLDDAWGQLYDTPRPTGWTDTEYRSLLQTRVKVLTGCGTAANVCSVLDYVLGEEGATEVESRFPAQAIITFSTVSAMRTATDRLDLINSILPDLIAAGIDYHLFITFTELALNAAIQGDATVENALYAAIQGEPSIDCGLNTVIAIGGDISAGLYAAVQIEQSVTLRLNTAVSDVRSVSLACLGAIAADVDISDFELRAAIEGDAEVQSAMRGAIQGEPSIDNAILAAVAKTFAVRSGIMACIKIGGSIEDFALRAAVQADQMASCGLKARIARIV